MMLDEMNETYEEAIVFQTARVILGLCLLEEKHALVVDIVEPFSPPGLQLNRFFLRCLDCRAAEHAHRKVY